jgi:hypothetical protein
MENLVWTPEWVEFGWLRYRSYTKTIFIGDESLWDLESRLLDEVGSLLSERRPIKVEELCDAARWRGLQSLNWIQSNDPKFIQEISRLAFDKDAANFLRHHILMILKGVGLSLASAVVTMYDQYNFTVIDARSKASLKALNKWPEKDPEKEIAWDHPSGHGYMEYVSMMRYFAGELYCELRNLERALWQWHRDSEASKRGFLDLNTWQEIYPL